MNGVAAAVATVDYDAWARHPDGTWIPQTSAPEVIQAMLELLDPCPGQRLLEVGTGSGYSAALLAQVLGPQGRLVSLDVDPGLVERAQRLHRQAGHGQVEVHRADGFGGWPSAAPFEGIVAWATPHLLPRAWVEQTAVGGTIVTPVEIARVAAANAVLCCRVAGGEPGEATLHPGSFVEMAPEVITSPGTPIRHVDAVRPRGDGAATWISGHRLHGQPPEALEPLLNVLESAASEPGFLDPEGVEAFTAFVLAAAADPASAGTPDDYGLGVATPGGVAVVLHDGTLLAAGSAEARGRLERLRDRWLELGQPGHRDLVPAFTPSEEGWIVRALYRPTRG